MSRNLRILASVLISALLLWLALKDVDWDQAIAAMRNASYFYVVLMLPLTVWTLYIRAQRWRVFLGGVGTAPMSTLVSSTNIGFMANMVLPLRVGEVIRPVLLSRKENLALSGVLGSCLLERIFDMFCILTLFAIAAVWVDVSERVQQWGVALLSVALTVGAALAILRFQEALALRICRRVCDILPANIGDAIYDFAVGFVKALSMLGSASAFARAFAWTFFLWAVIGFLYVLGFWAFHLDVPLVKGALVLTALIAIAVSVPSAPGFIGSYQLGCVLALGIFGIDESAALAFSLVLHVTQFVSVIGAGLYSLWKEGMSFSDVEAQEVATGEVLAVGDDENGDAPLMSLDGKTIVLGVSGGIAAYKAAEIVRLLGKAGALVRVVMTRSACEFITPLTLQTLSGNPVSTSLFDLTQESEIGHIELADSADLVLVAPATANLVGKLAHGLADDLLSTVLLATRAPIVLAPAMNVHMYENAAVQDNLALVAKRGVRIVEPGVGSLACGYEGPGRLPEPVLIVEEAARAVSSADFAGEKVVVTAGPNREPLDPVRFLSNRSSGRMGYALACAAWRRGADVVLVAGPTSLPDLHGVRTVRVGTAAEMHKAVKREVRGASVLVMAAAVADYRPKKVAPQKIKKSKGKYLVELERTVDILADIGAARAGRVVVGFAAETEDVVENAERKLREKKLDLIVANDVSRADAGFEVPTNAVTLIDGKGREELALASKETIADRVLDRVAQLRATRGRRGRKSRARR